MGRKVIENHAIVEKENKNATEELIKQQNMEEEFVIGEEEIESKLSKIMNSEKKSKILDIEAVQDKEGISGSVILVGAATYLDFGIRFFKNKPVKITDQRVYEQLLKTGLFVHI